MPSYNNPIVRKLESLQPHQPIQENKNIVHNPSHKTPNVKMDDKDTFKQKSMWNKERQVMSHALFTKKLLKLNVMLSGPRTIQYMRIDIKLPI